MPNILIATVGLPRSGKTTWARDMLRILPAGGPGAHPRTPAIVSPDSFRLAIHGRPFAAEAEPFVWACVNAAIAAMFGAGHDTVIVDATNTTRKRRDALLSPRWETRFKLIRTSNAVCFRRLDTMNSTDYGHVQGLKDALARMYKQWEPLQTDERLWDGCDGDHGWAP